MIPDESALSYPFNDSESVNGLKLLIHDERFCSSNGSVLRVALPISIRCSLMLSLVRKLTLLSHE